MPNTIASSLVARHDEAAARVLPKVNLIVGPEERPTGAGGVFEHVNPSTGRAQAEIPLAGARDVDDAVAAARRALKPWRAMKPSDRRDVLFKFAQLVRDYEDWDALQVVENGMPSQVVENGMPSLYASQFAGLAYDWCSYYAAWADKLVGDVAASNETDGFLVVTGEKRWSTHAQHADVCELLVRTDPTDRHGGLTYLLADLRAPEVTVRPIRTITPRWSGPTHRSPRVRWRRRRSSTGFRKTRSSS